MDIVGTVTEKAIRGHRKMQISRKDLNKGLKRARLKQHSVTHHSIWNITNEKV